MHVIQFRTAQTVSRTRSSRNLRDVLLRKGQRGIDDKEGEKQRYGGELPKSSNLVQVLQSNVLRGDKLGSTTVRTRLSPCGEHGTPNLV